MPTLFSKVLAGCAFVALSSTALLADPPQEMPTEATEAAAVDINAANPAAPLPPEPPQPDTNVPAFQPVHTDSGQGGVVFRPPKRPSQVKPVPLGQVELESAPAPESDAEPVVRDTLPPDIVEDVRPEVVPQTLPPAAVESVATSKSDDEAKVGTMSFNGVEPGKTTLDEMKKQWGEPASESSEAGTALYTFAMDPFKQVDVTAQDDMVTSVVVYLDPPMLPGIVANELRLRQFAPVPIPDPNGQLLGQVFPERGVMFGFAAEADVPRVAQIVVEPISAEPFVLRALYDFNHRYSSNLEDLNYALSQDDNDARAHWVKSRVLAEIGKYDDAVTEARTAVRLEPEIPTYRLQLAHNLGLQGGYDEATKIVEAIRSKNDLPTCVRARAECEFGRLLAHRPNPDHKAAVTHFQAALKLASPLVSQRGFEIRRTAKQVLVDANAGIGLSIALGDYRRKSEVAAKWLDRGGAYSDQYAGGDNGPKHLPLKILKQRLAAYAGMKGQLDPSQTVDTAIQAGRSLIAWSDDPLFKQQVEWLLGATLMDAVRVEHARGEHLQAFRYAEMAVGMLESAIAERQLAPAEQFALGRFYFLAGAVQAVKEQDHSEAVTWYAKALPYLTSPASSPTEGLATGRLGEWLVSMGVTFWEVGQKEKAVELTERGADMVQQAVNQGIMKKSAVGVPYSNLATMHESLGNETKASTFSRLAKTVENDATETKLR